jgi:hypothetical protein
LQPIAICLPWTHVHFQISVAKIKKAPNSPK